MSKTPLWLKRFPFVGKFFWGTGPRPTAAENVFAHGVMTTHWHGPNGDGGQTVDADGDIVRRWGARRPFSSNGD